MASIKSLQIDHFLATLASKQPVPGGGAAAAVAAAIGNAAASMAAAYTTRKKDIDSGASEKAAALQSLLGTAELLKAADDDTDAYADLQRTWKEKEMPAEEKGKFFVRECVNYIFVSNFFAKISTQRHQFLSSGD
jgi:formiminotetrahydrofolate cyclodeaminase